VNKAFVLGAGLGSRLKKLTEKIPKPMIPVFGKPLIEFSFDHLIQAGIKEFIVNTHHNAKVYTQHFESSHYQQKPISFVHEPNLLDTGGGIKNVSDLLDPNPFIIYNGDVLTDLPLKPLIDEHRDNKFLATLVLRSNGDAKHIALDRNNKKITDIRNNLNSNNKGTHQFTGIYACSADFLNYLNQERKHSVIPVFLNLIKEQLLGGIVIDEGEWWDLGTRDSYLDAHKKIPLSTFPSYRNQLNEPLINSNSKTSSIHESCFIDESSFIGENSIIEANTRIINSVIWPGAKIIQGSSLERCIVRHKQTAKGKLENEDI
tara:strand:+ start:2082 stop:3032 length:951 start_codon:yes stop_codon:yes gene_type:complete